MTGYTIKLCVRQSSIANICYNVQILNIRVYLFFVGESPRPASISLKRRTCTGSRLHNIIIQWNLDMSWIFEKLEGIAHAYNLFSSKTKFFFFFWPIRVIKISLYCITYGMCLWCVYIIYYMSFPSSSLRKM